MSHPHHDLRFERASLCGHASAWREYASMSFVHGSAGDDVARIREDIGPHTSGGADDVRPAGEGPPGVGHRWGGARRSRAGAQSPALACALANQCKPSEPMRRARAVGGTRRVRDPERRPLSRPAQEASPRALAQATRVLAQATRVLRKPRPVSPMPSAIYALPAMYVQLLGPPRSIRTERRRHRDDEVFTKPISYIYRQLADTEFILCRCNAR